MGAAAIKRRDLVITDPARKDLDDIYDYIAQDSPAAAETFVTGLVGSLYEMADLGLTGSPRDWVRPGLRLHVHGKYCAYFRVTDDDLVVIRVVHGARDVDALSFSED